MFLGIVALFLQCQKESECECKRRKDLFLGEQTL